VLARALGNLVGIVDKGSLYAESEKIDPSILLGMRLYPNMFAFARQIQVATDTAKGCMARLAVVEAPKFPDTEASFAELKQRLEKTLTYVKGFQASQLEGADSRPVVLKFPTNTLNFSSGFDYLFSFVLPNVHFHSSMAYGILRHAGVKLAKSDFLGNIGAG
jgi:hypothetical protein